MTGSCERALVLFLRGIRIASPVKVAIIIFVFHRPRICHRYHRSYLWRKFCPVEKFQISVKNLNNVWHFIKIYAVFVLNLCGENICGEKMTNRRSGFPPVTVSSTFYVFSNYGGHNHLCHLFAVYGVWTYYSIFHLITKLSSKGWLAIAKLKPL